MGYKVKYTGPKIDEALLRAYLFADRINGWIKLPSDVDHPVGLQTLTSPGNYAIDYWTDGPDFDLVGPINISVMVIDGSQKVQVVEYLNDKYTRKYNRSTGKWEPWEFKQTDTQASISPDEPTNPSDKNIWLDVTDPEVPVLKIFIDGEWHIVRPPTMMDSTIYDPTGMAQDVFAYIDNAIANANLEAVTADFGDHIDNADIHTTLQDKESWNAKPNPSEINTVIDQLQTELEKDVLSQAGNLASDISSLHTDLLQYSGMLTAHINDKVIHPNMIKQAEWDSKAAGDHTHFLDERVKIRAEDIIEGIIDPARIDPSAKEVVVKVEDRDALYALTIDDVQNGDMVWQRDGEIIMYVIDETKLGTDQAFKVYSSGVAVMDWENIENKPDTLEGYGITDVYNRTEVDKLLEPVFGMVDQYSPIMEGLIDFSSINANELVAKAQQVSLRQDIIIDTFFTLDTNMGKILTLAQQLQTLLS